MVAHAPGRDAVNQIMSTNGLAASGRMPNTMSNSGVAQQHALDCKSPATDNIAVVDNLSTGVRIVLLAASDVNLRY